MKSPNIPSLPMPSNSNQTPPSTPSQSVQSSPPQQSSSMNPSSSLPVPAFTPITPTNISDAQLLAPAVNAQVPGSPGAPVMTNGKRKGSGVRICWFSRFFHYFVAWLCNTRWLSFDWTSNWCSPEIVPLLLILKNYNFGYYTKIYYVQ